MDLATVCKHVREQFSKLICPYRDAASIMHLAGNKMYYYEFMYSSLTAAGRVKQKGAQKFGHVNFTGKLHTVAFALSNAEPPTIAASTECRL